KIELYAIDNANVNKGVKIREIYLSYPESLVIGGGTMIKKKANESYLRVILTYNRKYTNPTLITTGCGVANPALSSQIGFPTDAHAWATILNKCIYISVRGPLSKDIIVNDWRVTTPVVILYDPALYFEQSKIQKSKEKIIGVNFCNIIGRIYGLDQKKVDVFAKQIVQKLLDNQWKVILFPTTDSDIGYMEWILGDDVFKRTK